MCVEKRMKRRLALHDWLVVDNAATQFTPQPPYYFNIKWPKAYTQVGKNCVVPAMGPILHISFPNALFCQTIRAVIDLLLGLSFFPFSLLFSSLHSFPFLYLYTDHDYVLV